MKSIAWACLKIHDKSVLSAPHIIVFHKKVFFVCFTLIHLFVFSCNKKRFSAHDCCNMNFISFISRPVPEGVKEIYVEIFDEVNFILQPYILFNRKQYLITGIIIADGKFKGLIKSTKW